MCPSYMVTREEEHSTRGRARLLFEMLDGTRRLARSPTAGGPPRSATPSTCAWPARAARPTARSRSTWPPTRPSSCPTTTAAGCGPAAHYSMGWLPLWARLAARGAAAGQRADPRPRSCVTCSRRRPGSTGAARIPLFAGADASSTGAAGARSGVGRTARRGGAVAGHLHQPLPPRHRPGGRRGAGGRRAGGCRCPAGRVLRPDLDLHRAARHRQAGAAAHRRHRWRRICGAGVLVVGLEPSCTAVFRVRRRASCCPATRTSSGSRSRPSPWPNCSTTTRRGWRPPRMRADGASSQTHCHQHAIMGFDADQALLRAAGVDVDVLDAGCCGLAGNFGFEAVTTRCPRPARERVLLPAVRDAGRGHRGAGRRLQLPHPDRAGRHRPARPVHLAEILAAGLHAAGQDGQPVRPSRPAAPDAADYARLAAGAAAAVGVAAGLGALARRRPHHG